MSEEYAMKVIKLYELKGYCVLHFKPRINGKRWIYIQEILHRLEDFVQAGNNVTVITRCGIMSVTLGLVLYKIAKEKKWDNFYYIDYGNILSDKLG